LLRSLRVPGPPRVGFDRSSSTPSAVRRRIHDSDANPVNYVEVDGHYAVDPRTGDALLQTTLARDVQLCIRADNRERLRRYSGGGETPTVAKQLAAAAAKSVRSAGVSEVIDALGGLKAVSDEATKKAIRDYGNALTKYGVPSLTVAAFVNAAVSNVRAGDSFAVAVYRAGIEVGGGTVAAAAFVSLTCLKSANLWVAGGRAVVVGPAAGHQGQKFASKLAIKILGPRPG
jgi:hypothetical protein